ncbi:MAG: cytidine deaminase [Fidelibacterota bacterium]|nr:MAG: cytidine deaminase [Candidatus Neomarinimicrobiota bacterium]
MDIADLVQQAQSARGRARVPYSHYPVGAAVLTGSGKVYPGCNIESSAFSTTICAERAAIFNAIASGEHSFTALVIVSNDSAPPCGACRQVIYEQCGEIPIYVTGPDGQSQQEFSTSQLLPYPFDLGKS